ncbi:MAG: N-acetylneuraminate synthase family protein, partial [Saprospiraceae bacterium]|nr:N-acetylneuraminate synthase family protein [Saprospiraceae bacterium]
HEGDFEYAKKLTSLAIESDVDYIKFQIYSGDTLVNPIESPLRNKHFKKFELSKNEYIFLAEMCREANVGFMASVWNPEFVPWINEYSKIFKIGSGDFTAIPIIDYFISLEKPLLLSTGLCTLVEVIEIVEYIQSRSAIYKSQDFLGLLQCTSMYPIAIEDANLNVMNTYKQLFNIPVGYSDHTEGNFALETAVAMGAEILEFHFTDDRANKDFRDHKVSLTKAEVLDLIEKIKLIKKVQGHYFKKPLLSESEHVTSFRRALYFNKDMKAGDSIKESDLISLRPNHGIDAREFHNVIGKRINRRIKKYGKIEYDDLE